MITITIIAIVIMFLFASFQLMKILLLIYKIWELFNMEKIMRKRIKKLNAPCTEERFELICEENRKETLRQIFILAFRINPLEKDNNQW